MTGNWRQHEAHEPHTVGEQSPNDDPSVWSPRLVWLVRRQVELCRLIDSLGQEQMRLVRDDMTEGLLGLLATRQAAVDELTAHSASLQPFRRLWEQFASRMPPADRTELMSLVEELAILLDRIALRDEADRLELERRREQIAGELGGLSRGRGAVAAYGPAPAGGPAFQDREG